MYRASNTFSVLQAIAATAGLAILLWSIGLPSFRLAEAADVTNFSDTLSTASPSASADHDISFIATNGVSSGGQTIVITFDAAGDNFDISNLGPEDIDLLEGAVQQDLTGTDWTVSTSTSPDTLTFTSVAGDITAGNTVTILIGSNTTDGGPYDSQIGNPGSTGSYKINVTSGAQDTGETVVAIVSDVTVSASVDTVFNFTVSGTAAGIDVNGDITGGTTTATEIAFGVLEADTASTAAQVLGVQTNAKNGFTVTVQADQMLTSSNGADIDGFVNGNYTTSPQAWTGPTPVLGNDDTYGHWGITSDDATLSGGDTYGSALYVSASSTAPVEVFYNDGPSATDSGQGIGTTTVGYTVEISSLQEAAEDYTATLTYVATPVF